MHWHEAGSLATRPAMPVTEVASNRRTVILASPPSPLNPRSGNDNKQVLV